MAEPLQLPGNPAARSSSDTAVDKPHASVRVWAKEGLAYVGAMDWNQKTLGAGGGSKIMTTSVCHIATLST